MEFEKFDSTTNVARQSEPRHQGIQKVEALQTGKAVLQNVVH